MLVPIARATQAANIVWCMTYQVSLCQFQLLARQRDGQLLCELFKVLSQLVQVGKLLPMVAQIQGCYIFISRGQYGVHCVVNVQIGTHLQQHAACVQCLAGRAAN